MIDVFTKYAWLKFFKDKKAKTVLLGFVEIVNKSNRKPNKLWVDQEKEFYISPMWKWLDVNYTLTYSTHNEGVSQELLRGLQEIPKVKSIKKWQLIIKN